MIRERRIMKITRLHIILLIVVLALGVLNLYQYSQDKKQKEEAAAMLAKQQAELQKKQQEEKARKESWAKQTIAVAGEIWQITKKEGRDVARGQETLKLAKDSFDKSDFDSALDLSLQSIDELQSAPFIDVKYTVRRGDCLWNIARQPEHYGRGRDWVKIWKANKKQIKDYDLIHPKQVLTIPVSERQNAPKQDVSAVPNS